MGLSFEEALCEAVAEAEIRARARRGEDGPAAAFRREADRIYETLPPPRRGPAFAALYRRLFEKFGYPARLEALLAEVDGEGRLPGQVYVARALRPEDECARLGSEGGRLGLRLRPETLRNPGACAYLLRHELTHVLDLLDPAFGHEPGRPLAGDAPLEEGLLRDRYRTLWDLSVDGRLERRGWLPEGARARRAVEFQALFPLLEGTAAEGVFEALWGGPRPCDASLRRMVLGAAELCAELGIAAELPDGGDPGFRPGAPCSLCRFPTFEWAALAEALTRTIQAEFPGWDPRGGVCTQCANRYRFAAEGAPAPAGGRAVPATPRASSDGGHHP